MNSLGNAMLRGEDLVSQVRICVQNFSGAALRQNVSCQIKDSNGWQSSFFHLKRQERETPLLCG